MYSAYLTYLRAITVLISTILLLTISVPDSWGADYFLGSGDVLKITVYDNDDLTTLTRVSDDGNIIMPLLGQVKVDGLSVSHASEHIAALLADGYIINPQVNIFVQEFRSKKAVVLGQIQRPGIIEMSGPITLLELISKAGGLASDYGETASVKRENSKSGDVIMVNLKSLIEKGDVTQNIQIQDGDTIYVSKAGMCYVNGAVMKPGAYKCGNNITILKLVTLAGGFSNIAARSKVRILRIVNGVKTLYKNVEMDTIVQPDDVIVVPESFF